MSYLKVTKHMRNIVIASVLISTLALSFWGIRITFADDGSKQNFHNKTIEMPSNPETQIRKHLKANKSVNPEKYDINKTWHGHRKPNVNPEDLKLKIQSALEAGKITQQEAESKLQHLEKMTEKGHMKKIR